MIEGGYIRLYRSLTRWEWYHDANTLRVFLHLLLTVNYESKRFEGRVIERGQRATSVAKLSEELQLSAKSVRTALKHLQTTGEVAIEASSKYSIFTVNHYCFFQRGANEGQTAGKPRANKGQQWKKEKEIKKRERRESAPNPLQVSYDIDELEEINTLDAYA